MPRVSRALLQLPPSTEAALQKLGSDLALGRMRRGESLRVWADRIGVSVPTLMRMEAGDSSVGIGILATALWLLGMEPRLADLAAPEHDRGALEKDVRQATELGRARAKASAKARLTRATKGSA